MNTFSPIRSECPLCPKNNLLKETIIAQTTDAYLIKAYNSLGNYLIVPLVHTESPETLPRNWWGSVSELLTHVPHGEHYNISVNIGADAGQSVKHIHFWVIPRTSGQPASGKGFARLINDTNTSSAS
jgi:diadenosine tetraphosphate (Ap4A) HIT family hydrolase